jgi:hypothetical protein
VSAHAAGQDALRARLDALLGHPGGLADERAAAPRPCDALVVHVEVTSTHGVGALLETLFGTGGGLVTVRSADHFGGAQRFGDRHLLLSHAGRRRPEVYGAVARAFLGDDVRRILCVPYYPDDARTAVALHDVHGAPLCTWVMDDQNVAVRGIDDATMAELLAKSRLRLAISPELRAAYEAKYQLPFHVAPPAAPAALVRTVPELPPADALAARRGLVVGNIWGQRWLELLRQTVRGSGVALEWSSPSAYRFERFDPDALRQDGIVPVGALPQPEYVAALRAAPFVVVPSGTLDADDDRQEFSRYSLPSRMTFALAVSHVPLLVLGSPDTAAARFAERLGVGRVVPYDTERFRAAVDELTTPDVQRALRARAAELARRFSSEGFVAWLWRSLEAGAPADGRFDTLGAWR